MSFRQVCLNRLSLMWFQVKSGGKVSSGCGNERLPWFFWRSGLAGLIYLKLRVKPEPSDLAALKFLQRFTHGETWIASDGSISFSRLTMATSQCFSGYSYSSMVTRGAGFWRYALNFSGALSSIRKGFRRLQRRSDKESSYSHQPQRRFQSCKTGCFFDAVWRF